MDAKRLEIARNYNTVIGDLVVEECLQHIDQQQAEIERLNRAYTLLVGSLQWYGSHQIYRSDSLHPSEIMQDEGKFACDALGEAQRIKDGETHG
ncbi:hypothetical protein DFQ01_12198 [Paenibacillus cellulosilyticus]|uniref:Uncharacterized protein n=2 Tax=Paenibacillus cellulosilyticus TaxID=375489 RepID=A0A2V2YQ13_9BACL|nr:hypothetical protein DFQ01_12198 [Paenibacillus cellulosilyticus]